jgi:hypothetical protein
MRIIFISKRNFIRLDLFLNRFYRAFIRAFIGGVIFVIAIFAIFIFVIG